MNQDKFFLDIPNQFSNITMSESNELFNENNLDLPINQNNQFSQEINFFSINNSDFINFPNRLKNEYKAESDKEKEIKFNIDTNNINNNINNSSVCINNNITKILDDNNFIINSNLSNSVCNCSCCKYSQNTSFKDNNNKIHYEENFLNSSYNNDNHLFNIDESKNYINLFNKNNKTNFLFDNNNNKNDKAKNYINIDLKNENNTNNSNKDIDKVKDKEIKEKNNNVNKDTNLNNDNIPKIIINLSAKRKLKKIRRKENKVNVTIEYGHPKKIYYKTMKQKLNIHKKLDLECRTDTFLFIYSISNLKKILAKIISKKKIKDKIYFNRIQNIYKNSILSLQHREYAQDITGYKLL